MKKEHSICHRNLPQIYQMVYLLSAQPKLASFSLFIFIKQQKRNILIVQMMKKKKKQILVEANEIRCEKWKNK